MTEFCIKCKKKIKRKDNVVDIGQIDNPLLFGKCHTECFLVMMYEELEAIRLSVSAIESFVGIERK